MINLGTVRPGSTIYIPFESFATSTGAPITITGLATSDILVYKDGGTTQRASASGFTLLDTDGIDFDAITGIHGFSIDLSDNTTADFWAAGSKYWIVVSAVTVDSQTMSFIAGVFQIGISGSVLDTTIATLASQTSFTLTAGPADNDALNGSVAVICDAASAIQTAIGVVLDYTGSTKTVTLAADPAVFTMAAKDNISFIPGGINAYREDINATYGLSAIKTLSDAIAGYLDTEIAAIKAKTDQLVFTVANQVDSNVKSNAGTAITSASGIQEVKVASLASAALTSIAVAVWDALTSGMSTVGSIGKKLADWVVGTIDTYTGNTKQTGDNYARLGAPVGASISADIAGVPTAFGALVVSTGFTVLKIFRLVGAAFGGKTSGAGTATITIRNIIDTLDALVVGMTGSDRTSMTFDLSA